MSSKIWDACSTPFCRFLLSFSTFFLLLCPSSMFPCSNFSCSPDAFTLPFAMLSFRRGCTLFSSPPFSLSLIERVFNLDQTTYNSSVSRSYPIHLQLIAANHTHESYISRSFASGICCDLSDRSDVSREAAGSDKEVQTPFMEEPRFPGFAGRWIGIKSTLGVTGECRHSIIHWLDQANQTDEHGLLPVLLEQAAD